MKKIIFAVLILALITPVFGYDYNYGYGNSAESEYKYESSTGTRYQL